MRRISFAVGIAMWVAAVAVAGPSRAQEAGRPDLGPFPSAAAFVEQQYRDLFGREADPAGVAYWSGRLDDGTAGPPQLIHELLRSTEFRAIDAPVVRLHSGTFDRFPAPNEVLWWGTLLRGGIGIADVAEQLLRSEEFATLYGELSVEQFVRTMYEQVLGRAPEAAAARYWVAELEATRLARSQFLAFLSESAEHRRASDRPVALAMIYIGMLARVPDAGGFGYWLRLLDGGTSLQVPIERFLLSDEYAARFVAPPEYVALGESFASGFGVDPFYPGTHNDGTSNGGTPNNCQRSRKAAAPLVAAARRMTLIFGACNGGITKDFYSPRDDREGTQWGEVPQLDHLSADTRLVTVSIGGNDASFTQTIMACWKHFLTATLCRDDPTVSGPVDDALARLDGRSSTPTEVTPYAELFRDVRRAAPGATVVAVGYPRLVKGVGADDCSRFNELDRRWMIEKIDELNAIIERQAAAQGVLFANPNPRFDGHEMCGEDGAWIFPRTSPGLFHPNEDGQRALSEEILATLAEAGE